MVNGHGVSRGDRNRNARLARLRELLLLENAIVAIDLADKKQMVVVTDHDSKVLARKTFRCRASRPGRSSPATSPAAPSSPDKADPAAARGLARGLGSPAPNTVYAARYRHLTTRETTSSPRPRRRP